MSLQELLENDKTAAKLYHEYCQACNKWTKYIRPVAIKAFNDYLDKNGKIYNHSEYYTYIYNEYNHNGNDKPGENANPELLAKYKKLCLLFHPDKLNNSSSNDFFSIITKLYKNGEIIIIKAIDITSELILELPDIKPIITTLNNYSKYINQLTQLVNSNAPANVILEVLQGVNTSTGNLEEEDIENENENEEFLSSTIYNFYKGSKNTINYINETFITDDQMIEKIKTTTISNESFIKYCVARYRDSENILLACKEWLEKQNDKIRSENADLRNKIENIMKLSSSNEK